MTGVGWVPTPLTGDRVTSDATISVGDGNEPAPLSTLGAAEAVDDGVADGCDPAPVMTASGAELVTTNTGEGCDPTPVRTSGCGPKSVDGDGAGCVPVPVITPTGKLTVSPIPWTVPVVPRTAGVTREVVVSVEEGCDPAPVSTLGVLVAALVAVAV